MTITVIVIMIICYVIMITHPISIAVIQFLADIRERKTGIRENKYKKIVDRAFNNFERDINLFFVVPTLIILITVFIMCIEVILAK